ncbi:RagB/SusD family nutrient uptake outer membrane protein [Chitinophaga rhizophila]|uniref:RagB/SusD family nutrient uptake outer membrane protein n=1 Tax=Chitinophaga rhizophila TaxID=2866212 RepID=A0ABS7GIN8_9BACT|nr:RagB/SusD family nutrient uptake outer membrane protein [Chitinophaga rhizophila]MBW8687566.1 RagB/SusD family nutrient uptake outer membrane protein [Chitinophaga rhizophila]
MKKIFASIIAISVFAACSKDFLEHSPVDQQTETSFYQNPDQALQALVAVYNQLNIGDFDNIHLVSELASDNCFGGGGTSDLTWKQWDRGQESSNMNLGVWQKYYTGIYRANVLLSKLEGVNWGADSTLKNTYAAEARFLRAYFYFDLVRFFGNVPLVTKQLTVSEYNTPQATPADVYKLIAEDLKFAAERLPAIAYAGIPGSNYGRVTKWAAESLIGRVFLYYTGYYNQNDLAGVVTKAQAINYLEDVITTGGYDLVDSFPRLWQAAGRSFVGEDNKETIWSIKFTHKGLGNWDQKNGNRMQVHIGIRNQVLNPYYKGWGAGTVNPRLWNAYDGNDTRRNASIISIEDENLTGYAVGDQSQYTGYFWKKYQPLNEGNADSKGGNFQIDNYFDNIVIRYADVLLMAAELNLEGNLSKAQTYYNQVRDRAFLGTSGRKTLTTADGKRLIMEERRLELALEGVRYWDLLRQGMNVAKAAIDNNSSDPQFVVNFRTETQGLFKIPEQEINLSSGVYKQNPGWAN